MIEAVSKHIFSNDYVLHGAEGSVAELDVSGWRERAEFVLDGASYRLYRDGMVGPFVIERDGAVIASARKPSAFRDRFEVELPDRTYVLRKTSWSGRRFGVFEGDRAVGEMAQTGWFSRRIRLSLPADWPAAVHIFLFWLALVIWNRDAAAAASTG
jgi:hypothetical protein